MENHKKHKATSALSKGFFLVAALVFAAAAVFAPAGMIAGALDAAAAVAAGRAMFLASAQRTLFERISLVAIAVIGSLLIVGAINMHADSLVANLQLPKATLASTETKAHIAKLERAEVAAKVFDEKLYDTAARWAENLQAEQKALNDLAVVRGELTGSEDAELLDGILADAQVVTKAVCQCSDALTKHDDLLKAYDAAETLRVKLGQLQGRINALKAQ